MLSTITSMLMGSGDVPLAGPCDVLLTGCVCTSGTASSQGVEGKELLREAVAAEPAVAPETTAAETLPAGE
jgi:hypothetical protein